MRVYTENGVPTRDGRGLFAKGLIAKHPQLPIEEEGRLHDPRLRENFFEQVFAYRRLKNIFRSRWRIGDLVAFHASEKLLLMAHDPRAQTPLGRIVAEAKDRDRKAVCSEYQTGFMRILSQLATTRKHCNVLQHILGYFRKLLDTAYRQELVAVIKDFRSGLVPLIVPVTLMRHHVHRLDVEYLANQTYLQLHPKELMLRNHV